jgi:hypothetical protein
MRKAQELLLDSQFDPARAFWIDAEKHEEKWTKY